MPESQLSRSENNNDYKQSADDQDTHGTEKVEQGTPPSEEDGLCECWDMCPISQLLMSNTKDVMTFLIFQFQNVNATDPKSFLSEYQF